MNHLIDEIQLTKIKGGIEAGTSDQTTDSLDMQGYRGALLFVEIGTIAATGTVKVTLQHSEDNSTFTKLTGTGKEVDFAAADDNKFAVIDVIDPPGRYVRLHLDRGAANATPVAAFGIRYGAVHQPPTQATTELGRVKLIGDKKA